MAKILHILTDEKFSDYVINQFETPEMQSEFVLIPSNFDVDSNVKNIKKTQVVRQGSAEFSQLLTHLRDYSAIILHGMHWGNWQTPLLKAVPNHVKVAWVFWGGEIYGRSDCPDDFLAPYTRFITKLHSLHPKYRTKTIDTSWQIPIELYRRIDYCLTDEAEEYEYTKAFIGHPEMKHIWYTYYSMEETVGSLINERVSGNNIWLGNSATASNNLFDALFRLRRFSLHSRKLIIPLSYGSPWIRNAIIRLGKWLFGNRFVPLLEFLPREDYNRLMLDCGTMIMPHYNPQAQGNILTGLWLGMRVYLSEKSLTYRYFKRIGCIIYSLEHDFNKNNPNLLKPMTEEELQHNRKILYNICSQTSVQKAVLNIVNVLTK